MNPVGNIYDALFSFESKKRTEAYPIHKKIEYEGLSLLDWIDKQVELEKGMRILDAGCGTGNTLFHFHKKYETSGLGLSLSQHEIDFAEEQAAKVPEADISFVKRDFSLSLDDLGLFDFIVCIESLKHTPDPSAVVANLSQRLKPGGTMLIVDDYLTTEQQSAKEVNNHVKLWHAPGFISARQMQEALQKAIGVKPQTVDLSAAVPAKSAVMRAMLIGALRVIRLFLPKEGSLRRNIDTYWGAMILESLYASKRVGYFALMIQKGKS